MLWGRVRWPVEAEISHGCSQHNLVLAPSRFLLTLCQFLCINNFLKVSPAQETDICHFHKLEVTATWKGEALGTNRLAFHRK